MADFMSCVPSAATRPCCSSSKTGHELWEGEGIAEWMLDAYASCQSIFTACSYRELLSFVPRWVRRYETSEAVREAASCISEVSSAGFFPLVPGSVRGVPPSSCASWTWWEHTSVLLIRYLCCLFVFSFVNHANKGWYLLSKSHVVSNAVWFWIHHDPKDVTVRVQMRTTFSGSVPKIFTYHNGPCRLDRMQVKVVPVPAWQVSRVLQIPL